MKRQNLWHEPIPPEFEEKLHSEIGQDIVRKELRDALQADVKYRGPAKAKRKPARQSARTMVVYKRIREIPRDVPLDTFVLRCDRMQRPFPVPGYIAKLIKSNRIPTWQECYQNADARNKIHNLRQRAWKSKP